MSEYGRDLPSAYLDRRYPKAIILQMKICNVFAGVSPDQSAAAVVLDVFTAAVLKTGSISELLRVSPLGVHVRLQFQDFLPKSC